MLKSAGQSNAFLLLCWTSGWLVLLLAEARADDYTGRIMLGSYLSREDFSTPPLDGQSTNDYLTASGQFFLDVAKMGPSDLDLTIDVRDKNDFFDKLDEEKLQLTGINKLEPYQLSIKDPRTGGLYWEAGRFGVPEAGSAWNDGAELGETWYGAADRTSIFGGLNARQPYQSYPTFNPNSPQLGVYNVYQPKFDSWARTFYLSNAVVSQMVDGQLTRLYFYTDTNYQWSASSRVSGMLYLDFVPDVYIQTGLLTYTQLINPRLTTTVSAIALDVVQYSNQQGILERLPSSPYKGATADAREKVSDTAFLDLAGRYGYRTDDGLSMKEVSVGSLFPRLFGDHFQFRDSLIYREDFTAIDKLMRLGVDYYSNAWELSLSIDYGIEYETSSNVEHPVIFDSTLTRYFTKDLFSSLSFEVGENEVVSIYSASIAVGYRFGNRGVAPVHDATPLQGEKL